MSEEQYRNMHRLENENGILQQRIAELEASHNTMVEACKEVILKQTCGKHNASIGKIPFDIFLEITKQAGCVFCARERIAELEDQWHPASEPPKVNAQTGVSSDKMVEDSIGRYFKARYLRVDAWLIFAVHGFTIMKPEEDWHIIRWRELPPLPKEGIDQ